jgi:hypothetical protein
MAWRLRHGVGIPLATVAYAMYTPSAPTTFTWTWAQRQTTQRPWYTPWMTVSVKRPLQECTFTSAERGHLLHALPWDTPPSMFEKAWKQTHTARSALFFDWKHIPTRRPFGQFVCHLNAFVYVTNELGGIGRPNLRGTVDLATVFARTPAGIEFKSSPWRLAPSWHAQLERHLLSYRNVILVHLHPEAAAGMTPAMTVLTFPVRRSGTSYGEYDSDSDDDATHEHGNDVVVVS